MGMAVFTRGLSGLREDFFALLHEDSLRCSTRSSVRRGEGEKKDWKKERWESDSGSGRGCLIDC